MNNSVNGNYIYMTGKLAILRNYLARITAVMPVSGGSLPKFEYSYIKS